MYVRNCQVCQDYYGESESLFLKKKQTYYNSYCLPLMDYCINIWGHCNKTQLERIKEYFVYKTEFYVLCQVIMFVMEGYCLINMIIL